MEGFFAFPSQIKTEIQIPSIWNAPLFLARGRGRKIMSEKEDAKQGDPAEPEFINPFQRFLAVTIPAPVAMYRGLSPGAKLVYGRLERYAGRKGVAFPHVSEIAKEVGLGERQTKEYLAELVEQKFIHRFRVFAKGNVYKFCNHPCLKGQEIGSARTTTGSFVSDSSNGRHAAPQEDSSNGQHPAPSKGRDAAPRYPIVLRGSFEESHSPLTPQNDLDPETRGEIAPPPMKRKFNWGKRPKEEKPHGNSDRMRVLREQLASESRVTVPEAPDRGHAYNRTPPVVDSHSAPQTAGEPRIDFISRWNELVPSSPVNPFYYSQNAKAYRSDGFSQQFDALCAKCEVLLQNGKDWATFPFCLKYDSDRDMFGWQKVMAGEYDRTRKDPGRSKMDDMLQRVTSLSKEYYPDEE